MKEAFVIESLRTPLGSFGGGLAEVPAAQLGATVIKAVLERAHLPTDVVDEVVIGQVISAGCGQAPARQAMRLRDCQIAPMPWRSTRFVAVA